MSYTTTRSGWEGEQVTGNMPLDDVQEGDVECSENTDGDDLGIVFLGDVDPDVLDDDDDDAVDNHNLDNNDASVRVGTTSSARFNILATMVGGGSLSLPMAFAKSGNVLTGPILLILSAIMSEFCFRIMVKTARLLSYKYMDLSATTKVGHDSFESIAASAFGPKAYVPSMILVTSMCFFASIAYSVLLRDILEPITSIIFGLQAPGPSWKNNSSLWVVILIVTPLCTLRTLTSLKRFGAASMYSVFILGCCVLYRSFQCNLVQSPHNDNWQHWTDSFRLWPDSLWDVLDVFPLYISCYVCHYNIPTVHNELRRPTVQRVSWWLRSTTWVATLFYLFMGISGSAYGAKCTASGHVQGNILLDFGNSDPLLSIGRACLAITISIAFPMLTIPARDIVLRSLDSYLTNPRVALLFSTNNSHPRRPPLNEAVSEDDAADDITEPRATLRQPLLPPTTVSTGTREEVEGAGSGWRDVEDDEGHIPAAASDAPFWLRLVVSMVLLWTAAAVASVVDSIDTVWDLLGSSLSIFLSVLIPAGSFLIISHRNDQQSQEEEDQRTSTEQHTGTTTPPERSPHPEEERTTTSRQDQLPRYVSWALISLFVPLMFLSSGNAIYHTFFEHMVKQTSESRMEQR